MAGTVKRIVDAIIVTRSKGNPSFVESTRAKLILKGLNPAKFTDSTPDDPALVQKARGIAAEFGVQV